ncbi:inverted formin-2-like, partial [Diaphorina citri]|uniref:Inverted formin-2-like n=1 Tax=Diaphorina citri TaxID=121845 RepID=A0A3Q0JIA4_DIACI
MVMAGFVFTDEDYVVDWSAKCHAWAVSPLSPLSSPPPPYLTMDMGSFDNSSLPRPPVHPGREFPSGGSTSELPPLPPSSSSCSSTEAVNTPPLPLPRRSNLERTSSS